MRGKDARADTDPFVRTPVRRDNLCFEMYKVDKTYNWSIWRSREAMVFCFIFG